MEYHTGPGLYIVTLTNENPISVNADRPKIAEKCIKVTRRNCKFGKTRNLKSRQRDYCKTFGSEHVEFHQIAAVENAEAVEKLMKKHLMEYRIRGITGRPNEWLHTILPQEVEKILIHCLKESGLDFEIIGKFKNGNTNAT